MSPEQGDPSRESTSSVDVADGRTLDPSSQPQQQQPQQQQHQHQQEEQVGVPSPTDPPVVDTLEGDFFDCKFPL